MNLRMVKVDYIKPYEKNPRNNENAVEAVAESIRQFGFKQPIVVDGNMVVVAGHTRLKAANRLGLDEVPVVIADDLSEEQVKAFRIADNKVGEKATWDMELLSEALKEIDGFDIDMSELGFEEFELMALLDDAEPDGYDKDMIEKYTTDEEDLLKEKRIIITYKDEDEEDFLMGILKCDKLTVKNQAEDIMKRYERES